MVSLLSRLALAIIPGMLSGVAIGSVVPTSTRPPCRSDGPDATDECAAAKWDESGLLQLERKHSKSALLPNSTTSQSAAEDSEWGKMSSISSFELSIFSTAEASNPLCTELLNSSESELAGNNVAAQSAGGVPFGSSSDPLGCDNDGPGEGVAGVGQYCWDNINDELLGDLNAWRPGLTPPFFVGVRFSGMKSIVGFRVSRDGTDTIANLTEGNYTVQYTTVPGANNATEEASWTTVGVFERTVAGFLYFKFCGPIRATAIRIVLSDRSVIDELVVYEDERLHPGDIPKYVSPLLILPVMDQSKHDAKTGNHYSISVRAFKQQILPGGVWNAGTWGVLKTSLSRTFNATPVFGYGPSDDPEPDGREQIGFFNVREAGIAPAPNSGFNYPGYTVENGKDVKTYVDWHNDLVEKPWACDFDRHPDGAECSPLSHILPVDQSLYWANPPPTPCEDGKLRDCRPTNETGPELAEPYRGPVPIVIHVHGGHTKPESNGYSEAWWLPRANHEEAYSKHGTLVNRFGRTTNAKDGTASFVYKNDQPSATLWYHDQTLGMTRNNVYAGMAGFWLIREKNGGETGLKRGVLPHGAPKAGQSFSEVNLPPTIVGGRRQEFRDIPIVIQDRSFYQNGSLYYPGDRASYQGLDPGALAVPTIGNPTSASDISPIWNPEVYFDVMVVNGVSWPVHQVEPDLYRFRFLNGCNSRFLNLALCIVSTSDAPCTLDSASGRPASELDFFVIGSDQGLLPKVVKVRTGEKTVLKGDGKTPAASSEGHRLEALLVSPGERLDVLIDFRELPVGTVVRLINTAPDGPFRGFDDAHYEPAHPNTTGQVMEFHVVADDLTIGEKATSPQFLKLHLPDSKDSANLVQPETDGSSKLVSKVRDFALLEENSTLICAREEGRDWDPNCVPEDGECVPLNETVSTCSGYTPFGPVRMLFGRGGNTLAPRPLLWNDPLSINPGSHSTEIWEFWNWSEDSHTIHVHLVKFRVLQRFPFIEKDGMIVRGEAIPESPIEAGWKDSVIVFPGQVTRIAATFDIDGLYMWHCDILEHEDNEMRLPFCVGPKAKAPGCAAVP